MDQFIKLLATTLALITPTISSAQELHTFSNGEVADADKINENFEYVLERASGGCSAKQEGSNVVISCPDGSSGVIAGAGTVLVYPSGEIGSIPIIEYSNGDIVWLDANDEILGPSDYSGGTFNIVKLSIDPVIIGNFFNDESSLRTYLVSANSATRAYFKSSDCTGDPFGIRTQDIVTLNSNYWIIPSNPNFETLLFNSRRQSGSVGSPMGGGCSTGQFVSDATLLQPYTPAPEIVNAAYPVRLEQLP